MADNCLLCPEAIENNAGVTVIEESVGALTTTLAVPETEFSEALMVTGPAFNPVSRPVDPTTAMVGSELIQTT